MNFKQYLVRKLIPTYFMIVTFINLGIAVIGTSLYPDATFRYVNMFFPLLLGTVGCLPLLIEYLLRQYLFRGRQQSLTAFLLEALGELALLELCIVGGTALVMGFDSPWTAVVMGFIVLAVFSAVTAIEYLKDRHICHQMNDAIAAFRHS